MRRTLRFLRLRRVALALLGAFALVLLAGPLARADVWANVGPASSLAGLASRYPLGNYALDEHFTAISAGVFSGRRRLRPPADDRLLLRRRALAAHGVAGEPRGRTLRLRLLARPR